MPMAAMAGRLARGEDLPGFGHFLYPEGDPRATAILAAITRPLPGARALIESAAAAGTRLTGHHPNVDFALAAAADRPGLASERGARHFYRRPHRRLDRARDRAIRERGPDPPARPVCRPATGAGLGLSRRYNYEIEPCFHSVDPQRHSVFEVLQVFGQPIDFTVDPAQVDEDSNYRALSLMPHSYPPALTLYVTA